ncbi:MAG: metal-dependent transcriptional regulator [Candidatus Borkfalkiaceae bacterium]|nr:metal-dependent transcriptional regulator [Clostridia bacterium]MDY6223579.1 metal-dependent transcriptional regulator [Christensenellaceae bacterium]
MRLQESGEMYLECILRLSREKGNVRAIDIGEYRGFSKPSISRAVKQLKEGGFIDVAENGLITLTPTGRAIAEKIYERHTVLSEFFEELGVEQSVAAEDACRIEHVISDESFAAIKKNLSKSGKRNG